MMSADIRELNNFITEVEQLLKLHNVPAALVKCNEAKRYISLLSGVAA